MEWTIGYYNEELQQLITEFPDGIQARFIHLTERMVVFGPDLGMRIPAQWARGCSNCG
jgi:hypothetical protein